MPNHSNLSVKSLLPADLVARSGEKIGTVHDILINLDDSKVAYLLVEPTKSRPELQSNTIPLRFSAVSINQDAGCFELDGLQTALTHLVH